MADEKPVPASKSPVPGSAKKEGIDLRSTDAHGKQADDVKSHAERARKKETGTKHPSGEPDGAMKDQTAR
ncbi:hypothetical protein GXW71_22200 [Roseomonas hellenica]|uniref:Uncharacterized protein n=1 Tax=Plastoroseomonas hellenica TaxID=2687306 RepID=A0ABS5F3H1_9PROT|nr:hypothetical protein [Plastoroseomonas hellenica]MBR0667090.1 hypothetical protein [Plastoroseomonas hellenica]